jgi:hypothetical protein
VAAFVASEEPPLSLELELEELEELLELAAKREFAVARPVLDNRTHRALTHSAHTASADALAWRGLWKSCCWWKSCRWRSGAGGRASWLHGELGLGLPPAGARGKRRGGGRGGGNRGREARARAEDEDVEGDGLGGWKSALNGEPGARREVVGGEREERGLPGGREVGEGDGIGGGGSKSARDR